MKPLLLVFPSLLCLPACAAQAPTAETAAQPQASFTPPGPNVALHKPYEFDARPNYRLCTDPDDSTQLTDGVYTQGYFWVQKTTVGWQHHTPALITVDLGKIEPIAGASYSTAAGTAGVSWPATIALFVSDDGKKWTNVGDLVALGTKQGTPAPDKYSQFRFATDKLAAHGRYVEFAVDGSPYIFVDEIEVYRGPDELLTRPSVGKKVTNVGEYFKAQRIRSAMLWRLRTDLRAAQDNIQASALPPARKTALLAQAEKLRRQVETLPAQPPAAFRTVLPFSELHARIYALNAPLLRAQGLGAPLTAWHRNRWDMLAPTDGPTPAETKTEPTLSVHAMRNEVRAAAFNLTNSTDRRMPVTVAISGLPARAAAKVKVLEVLFTDTKDRVPIADALPEAKKTAAGYRVTVPAGCTRQVWLSVDTSGFAAGEYAAQVAVSGRGNLRLRIPLQITVYPLTLPKERTIAVGGWDYTNGSGSYDARPSNIPLLIEALRTRGVNTPWATAGVMPTGGKYDDAGHLLAALNFAAWDEWVTRWPGAKYYCVFLSVRGSFSGERPGTPRFKTMVGDYFQAWTGHLRRQNIDPGKLAVLILDEPHAAGQAETIITWAKAIKAGAPDVVIWEDPTFRNPTDVPAGLFEVCDVLCPNLPMFMGFSDAGRRIYLDQQKAGKTLWFYSCSGPAKLLDPYNYHRGQFWWALKCGAVGSCYWAFGDEAGSGNSWNAYLQTRNQYSPLYLDAHSVTTGKHMEAIREGAEDYEYFVLLRKRIASLEKKGVPNPTLDRAKALLTQGPARVVAQLDGASLGWRKDFDRGLMDSVRLQVLEMLARLAKQ